MDVSKVSWVLPVYNCESTIADCLISILNQEVKVHEIIVINDGSTDRTKQILEELRQDNLIIINNDERKGAAHCRNFGNSICESNIIAVSDVDHYYKNRNEAIIEFFDKNQDKDVFYSALNLRMYNSVKDKYLMEAYEWDFKSKCPISHPTVSYRRKVAKKVDYMEETIDSDLYEFFLLDAHKKGFKFGGCQNPLMLKTEGGSNRNVEEAKKLKKELYKEYGIEID